MVPESKLNRICIICKNITSPGDGWVQHPGKRWHSIHQECLKRLRKIK